MVTATKTLQLSMFDGGSGVKPRRIIDKVLLADIRTRRCAVCNAPPPCDVSHIKTRGSGGPDTYWNCWPKCRPCHVEWGRIGALTFFKRHPIFWMKLKSKGWEIDARGKLWRADD